MCVQEFPPLRMAVAACLAGYAGSVVVERQDDVWWKTVSSAPALVECGVFACIDGSWVARSKYSD
jgi:hypothetical protein